MNKKGFSLIELLVVVVMIGILATIGIASFQKTKIKAQVAKSIVEMTAVKRAVQFYYVDTGVLPPECVSGCTATTDPLLSNVGSIEGWNGPYLPGGVHNRATLWGGSYGLTIYDSDSDGFMEVWGFFDEDGPGAGGINNEGVIPLKALEEFDRVIDVVPGPAAGKFQYSPDGGYAFGSAGWFILED